MSNSGFTAFTGIVLIVYAFFLLIAILAWVKIISKAGYSGWWVLIGFVPLVGAIMFLVFAFSKWPVQQRLEAATMGGRQLTGPGGQYGGYSGGGWSPPGGQQGPLGPMGGPQGPSSPQGWSPQLPQQGQQPPGPYVPPWN